MVLLSLHGLAAAQIAALLDCHLAIVRRFDREALAGPTPGAGGSSWAVTNRTCGMPLGMRRRFGRKVRYRTQIWSSSGP